MRLLNLCCGANRPQDESWWNLDNLYDDLAPGTPERSNLDAEPNYINTNLLESGLHCVREDRFDGILASHCFEHWDCMTSVWLMQWCRDVLKSGGILMVSVPDASYFHLMHSADTAENAVELFGEPIYAPDGEDTFFGYALWNRFHKAILTEDALWAYFVRSGFEDKKVERISAMVNDGNEVVKEMHRQLNRRMFSLVMTGVK